MATVLEELTKAHLAFPKDSAAWFSREAAKRSFATLRQESDKGKRVSIGGDPLCPQFLLLTAEVGDKRHSLARLACMTEVSTEDMKARWSDLLDAAHLCCQPIVITPLRGSTAVIIVPNPRFSSSLDEFIKRPVRSAISKGS